MPDKLPKVTTYNREIHTSRNKYRKGSLDYFP